MSTIITGRVFWTKYAGIFYTEKNGKNINVAGPTAKVVMLAIADSADDFGENSYNSLETLSTKTDLERRSVLRAIRGLIAQNYLVVNGLSVYGTNNFGINIERLGSQPARRARTGRPKSSDSESLLLIEKTKSSDSSAESSDSSAESSDLESPDPLITIHKPLSDSQPTKNKNKRLLGSTENTRTKKKGDAVDWLLQSKAQLDYQAGLVELQQRFERAAGLHPNWESIKDGWVDFTRFLVEKEAAGQTIELFYKWFNADKFRRDANMWMKPNKYKLWWDQAFTQAGTKEESIKIKSTEPTPFEKAMLLRRNNRKD